MSFWKFKNSVSSGKDNELILDGPISSTTWWGDEVTPQEFHDQLKKMKGNLTVHINSNGGDVFAGVTIYNALREYKGKVTVVVDALAASIASVIAMAGDVIEMAPGSMLMIHDPSSMGGGNAKDMRAAANVLDEIKDAIIPIYESKTGLSSEEIAQMMSDETWLTAKKAIRLGFADRIRKKTPEKAGVEDSLQDCFAYTMSSTKVAMNDFINKVNEREDSTMAEELEKLKAASLEEEAPVEEAPVEEAPAEEVKEEAPAEEIKEEAPAEEKTEEEAPVEEKTEEEVVTEPESEPEKVEEGNIPEEVIKEEVITDGGLGAADKLEKAIKDKDAEIASLKNQLAEAQSKIKSAEDKASSEFKAKNSLINRYASILDMATAVEAEETKEADSEETDAKSVNQIEKAYAKAFAELN